MAKKNPQKTIKSETLGTLQLSDELPDMLEYSTDYDRGGFAATLTLYSEKRSLEMNQTLEVASELVRNVSQVKTRLYNYVAEIVVPYINMNMRPNDPVQPDPFFDQLELSLVDVHPDGNASFWFSPSEILLGHGLVLYGKSDGTISDFDTPG